MWNEESLWKLRKEIVLNSLYYSDYENSFGVDSHNCCDFFDSYCEYLGELMQEDVGDNYDFFTLLPKYDLIQAYNLSDELEKAIEEVFIGEAPTFYNQFYGQTILHESKREEAEYLWNEDIYNLFNNLAPEGFYFGSNEGDGACIGFFKYDEEEM